MTDVLDAKRVVDEAIRRRLRAESQHELAQAELTRVQATLRQLFGTTDADACRAQLATAEAELATLVEALRAALDEAGV